MSWDPDELEIIEEDRDLVHLLAAGFAFAHPGRDHDAAQMPYRDYLQTDHWQAMRRRALLRAGGHCQRCYADDQRLDVHHLTYDRLGCEREFGLMVLCATCHEREHSPSGSKP